jgi:hypothetical protein
MKNNHRKIEKKNEKDEKKRQKATPSLRALPAPRRLARLPKMSPCSAADVATLTASGMTQAVGAS